MAADVHPGDARAVVGDLPLWTQHQGRRGDDFDMSDEGKLRVSAALALILQALTLPLLWIGQRALGRDFMLRRSVT